MFVNDYFLTDHVLFVYFYLLRNIGKLFQIRIKIFFYDKY